MPTLQQVHKRYPIFEQSLPLPNGRVEAMIARLEAHAGSARISLMRVRKGDWEVRCFHPDWPLSHPLQGMVGRGSTASDAVACLLEVLGDSLAA
jgi:hypothetical protein